MLTPEKKEAAMKILWMLVFVLSAVQASWAFTARTGEQAEVGREEMIPGDLFIAGERVIVRGTVRGDLYAAGREVIVEGEVSGDAVLAGEEVTVGERGSIGQDLVFAARETSILGPVGGYALGAGRRITVDSGIGGNARFGVGELVLGEHAHIRGGLRYHSRKAALVSEGARVQGEVRRSIPELGLDPRKLVGALLLAGLVGKLFVFAAGLVLGLAAVLVMPRWVLGVTDTVKTSPGPCAGWGALVLFAAPVGAAAAMVTLVGAAVGVLVLLLYLAGMMLSQVLAGLVLGRLLLEKRLDLTAPGPLFWTFALGYFLLSLVRLIPVAGHLVTLAAGLFGFGGMALHWARARSG